MKLIVAVDENWGIGRKGDLLKSIPDDMKFFRETTRRAILVMGYNTLLSFPNSKPLPGRLNIVLADIPGLTIPGAVVCNSMSELLALLENFCSNDIYVIGGGMMYRQLLPYCDTALITKMRFSGEADTFIPNLDELPGWSVKSESEIKDYEGLLYSFVEYRNTSPEKLSFRSFDMHLPEVFAAREIFFNFYECTGSYRSELKELLCRYFEPIRDGVAPNDVQSFLSVRAKQESGSFGSFLRSGRLIADKGDFKKLNDRWQDRRECTGQYCGVTVRKKDYTAFAALLDEGASFEKITETFKA